MSIEINKAERIAMVRAMETVARQINDEEIFETWLSYGVADGDIDETTTDEELEYYIENDTFEDLMGVFLRLMVRAEEQGGLYCDHALSE
ncbi:MAG: hypothetical protein IKM52_06350 [Clostridia bacterium]|nr:hypothetical protein [Clostridia bacterium]